MIRTKIRLTWIGGDAGDDTIMLNIYETGGYGKQVYYNHTHLGYEESSYNNDRGFWGYAVETRYYYKGQDMAYDSWKSI